MRRDGVLTGFLWRRNSLEKVKVKAKPTNASKASGRCSRAKCSLCHDQPVSKAKSKTKGRNKRALPRLLVDDDWAFCKHAPAGRAKAVLSVLSRADYDVSFTSDALDACYSDADLFGHDVGDYAYDAYDACPAQANPLHHAVTESDLDGVGANAIDVVGDVSHAGMYAHDDVKDLGVLLHAAPPHNGDCKMHSCSVLGINGKLYTTTDPISVVYGTEDLKKLAPDVNTGICVKANDVVAINDDDVNSECHSTMALAKNDVIEDDEDVANEESRVIMIHTTDDVSDDDDDKDDLYSEEDADDFHSFISGAKWPACNGNEVLELVESEENSLSSDWCYVTSSDAVDDWYLC